jgi:hypothetical protein
MQGAMQKLHSADQPVVKKAEPKKAEPKKEKAAPKKAEAKRTPPKEEKTGLLKGLLRGLTGSKK